MRSVALSRPYLGLPGAPRPLDLLLDGLVLLTTEGHVAATPVLQRAAAELTSISAEDVRRWGWAAPSASSAVGDDEGLLAISARNLQIIRDAGAFAELPLHIFSFGIARMWIGDLAGVAAVMAETESIDAATGRYSGFLVAGAPGAARERGRGLRADRRCP